MRFQGNPGAPVIDNAIATGLAGIGTLENEYGQKISLVDLLDLNLNQELSPKETLAEHKAFLTRAKSLYGTIFGNIETKKSRELFTRSLRQGFEYWKNSILSWEVDSGVLAQVSHILTTPEPLSKIEIETLISGREFSPEDIRHLLAILKATFTVNHAQSEKNIFPKNLPRQAVSFDEKIHSLFRKRAKDSDFPLDFMSGDLRIKIKAFSSNAKADDRIFDKLGRRPNLEIEKINDILRSRFVVQSFDDAKKLKDFLLEELSDMSLEEKNAKSNTSSGDRGEEIVLLGKSNGTPCEIKIMTFDDYEQSETGINNHQIYAFLQDCQLYERYYGQIPHALAQEKIKKLSGDASIWKNLRTDVVNGWCRKYGVSISNLNNDRVDIGKGKAQELLRGRFDEMFFSGHTAKLDNAVILGNNDSKKSFFSYENMFRCKCLRADQGYSGIYTAMFLKIQGLIKSKTGIEVSSEEVEELFNDKGGVVSDEVFDVIKSLKGLPDKLVNAISLKVSATIN